ncbi:hypothetical protein AB0P21_40995 [Kribbella sp. NPDC056861]|uniref:hypothetical protein n=1 Tax=Kribbella sp. NPDC056861 TaxID=3154857 RepID=UPI003415A647
MDIGELARAGATTVVTAMSTGAWEVLRARIARLFGRESENQELELTADLDRARQQVIQNPDQNAVVEAELRGHLKQLLRTYPQLTDDFAILVAENTAPAGPGAISQRAFADRGSRITQIVGDGNGRPR